MTHSPDSNKICCPLLATGNLHKSKISDLIFSLCPSLCKSACCYCYYLTVLLPFPNTPCTSPVAWLFQNWCKIYKSSLIREYFHKGVLVTQNGIKAFHKFIHICSLIHVHSPREKQYSNGKNFFFVCLFVILGFEFRVHTWASGPALFLWVILRQSLKKYLPKLTLNPDPPDLCLLDGKDYSCETQIPSRNIISYSRAGFPR
jgi:hypothetical protein